MSFVSQFHRRISEPKITLGFSILELREITAGKAETAIIVDQFGKAIDKYLNRENVQPEAQASGPYDS